MASMQRTTALLVLCCVASVTLLAVKYVRGGPALLEQYNVMPVAGASSATRPFLGVTDADQSPSVDPSFEREVHKSKKTYRKLVKMLEASSAREDAIDLKVAKAMEFVSDQVNAVNKDVRTMNTQDSDQIASIPLLAGPPGVPGLNGLNGISGDNGPSGEPGPKGQEGATGLEGPGGPEGAEGFPGDNGPSGKPGRSGPAGPMGNEGIEGQRGLRGASSAWGHTPFDCMEAATQHMRLVHCNRQGCRLETLFAGRWGTVCSRGFSRDNADTLCKALGFSLGRGKVVPKFGGGRNSVDSGSAVSTGADKIWLSGVECLGGEGDVGDCRHAPWGVAHRCTHDDDVGMCCFGTQNGPMGVRTGKSDFDMCPEVSTSWARLRDCNQKTCRLDVKYDGKWGTVCDEGFTDKAATVVCKSLGFSNGGEARRAGGGQGPIWLSQVACAGSEGNLEWCPHSPWGNTKDCDHSMDAGVCCRGPGKPPPRKVRGPQWACAGGKNTVSSGATRLVECTKGGCRLEIKHNDEWGTICSQGWKDVNAVVACRSMGMPDGKSVRDFGMKFKKQAPENYKTWVSDVKCKGDESWVGSCQHGMWGEHECTHDQDVGVCCDKAWESPLM